ncbi:hypothetical protein HAX54_019071 [Datura stramonium]|uniref:Uncharacterized protein n=1 Tax=Datura stramonium TaxID=4076 RepID=A0ABS8UNG3_DATST|nr:hypothetical protein [Datura stramonium]
MLLTRRLPFENEKLILVTHRVSSSISGTNIEKIGDSVDVEIPIILGCPFLATNRALMDTDHNKVKFCVNNDEVVFNVDKGMKLLRAFACKSILIEFDDMDEGDPGGVLAII